MSLHFNTFIDNNSDHESNSEFFDNSLQHPYYENVSNTGDYVTVQNSNIQESISTSNLQYHQVPLQYDEHAQQNDFVPTQHDYDNASAKVSIPKISKRIDSSQNQILKIELEIVIKLQNDQTQQRTQYVRSSTLPKNRIVNRMSPYRKPNEQNFRNKSSNDAQFFMTVPQLNRSPAVHMQNVDNNRISRSQFQPDDDLNESFRSNYYDN
ncbi:hypothetical protein RhiirA5_459792 [Rhizophagus irregularis]|uniref:Uncharacterized protein n=3 Tax=Rhizophagus irregularis TaxID=588596 RepID=A0A2N0Q2P1_9GLOM|nr:hypothetical protein GLOIN_2v1839080 [Rhizophagus irregularis DAOM 181602=DAOM 197198]EXX59213.1 hypothetical protein RirG_190980 [Rhizophagus irregularis DAOM 197198w]PKC13315.1 hypothetical protein RhiirA5_459792 [Rhizophagus irregularis]POG74873.1 hypothetical protein GLOIN_2v1839080 [Rhizophagus irregularis DAOM 181602=DAOM 197198]UZO23505.1 hypothetical protein OCT59_015843 [Rhizophagus irregularis]GBC30682.1 hypothetical protein GLOIN_2v1839080 [Rhizophagus irregularis DAOM 181602=DAO|eukprot:XP_025181739.1 hypothetical protein GLOIN_2v1839080 [Rhizophagus irregularis DAOM 181602=DAOM 197198]